MRVIVLHRSIVFKLAKTEQFAFPVAALEPKIQRDQNLLPPRKRPRCHVFQIGIHNNCEEKQK
jgi:hypothetical protein